MDGCRVGVEDREVASKNYSKLFSSSLSFFLFYFFLRQGLMELKQASNSLCG